MTASHAPYLHPTQHLRATSHTQRAVYHTIPTYQLTQPLEPKQPKPHRTPLSNLPTRIGNSGHVLFALDPLIRLWLFLTLVSTLSSCAQLALPTSLYC